MRKRIWIPESFDYTSQDAEVSCGFNVTVSGHFIVDLIDSKTGDITEHYEFPNLITDVGLDELAQGTTATSLFDYLGVGTDSTPPGVGNTALLAEVARTNDHGGFGGLETNGGPITGSAGSLDTVYWFKRFVRHFFESEANGNLAEIGWFNQAAGGVMTARTLFKDSGGSPVVVVKTNDKQLRIMYEWRVYPPVGINPPDGNPNSRINSGTVILGATTHSWTGSVMNMFGSSEWGWPVGGMLNNPLGTFTAFAGPSGSLSHPTASVTDFLGLSAGVADSNTLDGYSVGTFRRDMLSTWNAGSSNFGPGGIKIISLKTSAGNGHFQIEISNAIPKTPAERLRMKFRVTLNRATT